MSFPDLMESGADLITIIGVLFAIFGFLLSIKSYKNEMEKNRLEREYGTFDDLDNKYVEFQYMCAQYPELDLFSKPAPADRKITEVQLQQERALFAVLISIFERACVMFERRAGEKMRELQYSGWITCMKMYSTRPSFLLEWNAIGDQFDIKFQEQMNGIIREQTDK